MTSSDTLAYEANEAYAVGQDQRDPLAGFRDRFHFPDAENGRKALYFAGNSLGLQPKSAQAYVQEVLNDWAQYAVEGHFKAEHPWMPYHEFVTPTLSDLVGALPTEVVAMNSLTVNLHLLMVSFYRPTQTRYKILMEENAFPSDRYALESQLKFHGIDPQDGLLVAKARKGETTLRTEDIEALIHENRDSLATVLIGGVNYYTGQFFELERITQAAHEADALMGVDLAHGIGNVPLQLHNWGVDFAAWCTYKYLNAGPGATAGIYVHERHAAADLPRFHGWWGQDKASRFLMGPEFQPIQGAEAWQLSNPAILPLATLRASLDIFQEATFPALRQKSEALTGYLEFLVNAIETDRISIITPSDPAQRGAQISLRVAGADKSLYHTLGDQGVICDWREPDTIRLAPVPLYNRFMDVYQFVELLKNAL